MARLDSLKIFVEVVLTRNFTSASWMITLKTLISTVGFGPRFNAADLLMSCHQYQRRSIPCNWFFRISAMYPVTPTVFVRFYYSTFVARPIAIQQYCYALTTESEISSYTRGFAISSQLIAPSEGRSCRSSTPNASHIGLTLSVSNPTRFRLGIILPNN